MITSNEFFKITRCVGPWKLPDFTIEEVQEMLEKWGYIIIVHKAKATIHGVDMNPGGEVRENGSHWEEDRERVLAVKPENRYKLPERVDSNEAREMDLLVVFGQEMKKKLMSL